MESGPQNDAVVEAEHAGLPGQADARSLDLQRARAQALLAPTIFLDEAALPDCLLVQHAAAELYAQAFIGEQAAGPRRFLGVLPCGSIVPQMPRHPNWRLCLVGLAADAVQAYEWRDDEPPQAMQTVQNMPKPFERAAALQPLVAAMQSIAHLPTSPGSTDCLADCLASSDPRAALQAWLLACLSSVEERRLPLPLDGLVKANAQARNSALLKMAAVMHTAPDLALQQRSGLAARAAEVARAQGLDLPKDASQARAGESVHAWAARAGVRLRRVALRSAWWQQPGLPLLGFLARGEQRGMAQEALEREAEVSAVALLPKNAFSAGLSGRSAYTWRGGQQTEQTKQQTTEQTKEQELGPEVAQDLAPFAYSLHGCLPERSLDMLDLLKFAWRAAYADALLLLAMGLAAGLIGALAPVAVAYVLQAVLPTGEISLLASFFCLILILTLVAGILHLCADLAALRIEGRLGNGLQSALFDRLVRLPLKFFASMSSGDLANRIASVDQVRRAVAHLLVLGTSAFCYAFGVWLSMLYLMPRAAVFAGLLMLLIWSLAGFTGWKQMQSLYEGEQIEGNVVALVVQLLQGIAKLRLAGAEDRGFGLWGRGFAELRKRITRGRKMLVHYAALLALAEVGMTLGVFALVAYAGSDNGANKPSTGEFLALITAMASFCASGVLVAQAICRMIMMQPLYARLRPILENRPESQEMVQPMPILHGGLEVLGLSFSYPNAAAPILQDISLQVRPGQFIAIVGRSGCGKSTLLRLLLGLEQPDCGSIYYDGRDLQSLSRQSLRRQIGVVLQNGRSMPGTLFENIAVAHDCTLEQAWAAARLAGLEEDIHAMPMGMHTVLSEGSAALSGGQVQRLLLARALAGQPRILFLDEATSALDNRTQAWISSSLNAMAMTRIVIAHRLSSVQQADLILVLRDGRIVETGKYAELMAAGGYFTELAQRQLL